MGPGSRIHASRLAASRLADPRIPVSRHPFRHPPGNAGRGDPSPEEVAASDVVQNPPSRPTAMGAASSSFTTGIVAVTMGTDADSSVPSSRTEPSS